jgi:hypothetical protein
VAATTALWRNRRIGYRVKSSDKERLRQRLRKMSNPELLLFGVTTKYQCSRETEPGPAPPEDVLVQLAEARKEWTKRNPSLPLRDSF